MQIAQMDNRPSDEEEDAAPNVIRHENTFFNGDLRNTMIEGLLYESSSTPTTTSVVCIGTMLHTGTY